MTAAMWRFMLAPFSSRAATPDSVIDAFAAELNQGDWYLDQHVLYRMIARWSLFFGTDRMMRSGYHDRRIDRGPDINAARNMMKSPKGGADLHFLRPPYRQDHWAFYREELVPFIIPKERVKAVTDELDAFLREFTKAFADSNGEIESRSGPNGENSKAKVYVIPAAT
jgi:hypothetical protein